MLKGSQALASLGRLVIALGLGVGIGTQQIYERHKTYWHQTIYRVQTVDFNLLAHTLPTKLSYALIKNQPEELQRTLDSNYSLFGLVVTDPSGKKIVTSSGEGAEKERYWDAALNLQELQKHSYDLLRDPPPLFPQGVYRDAYTQSRQATKYSNEGQVIGRVYYVRGEPPTFREDFMGWLENPLSPSSRFQVYTPTMLSWLGAASLGWVSLEWLLQSKRRQNRLAQEREQQLIDKTTNQLDAKEAEIQDLIAEKSQHAQQLTELLAAAESRAHLSLQQRELYEGQIEEHRQNLQSLEGQLQETTRLRDELHEVNHLKLRAEEEQRHSLEVIENYEKTLSNRLEAAHRQTLNKFEQKVLQTIEQSSSAEDYDWRIRADIDLSKPGAGCTLEADLVVISSYCVIVIEAKNYSGRIEPDGTNVKEARWINYNKPTGPGLVISSTQGPNPYKQMKAYVKGAALNWLNPPRRSRVTQRWGKINTYGVVVFPKAADLSHIESAITSRFYRVVTLDKLVDTLNAFNEDAKGLLERRDQLDQRPSAKQIENLLLGRPIRAA